MKYYFTIAFGIASMVSIFSHVITHDIHFSDLPILNIFFAVLIVIEMALLFYISNVTLSSWLHHTHIFHDPILQAHHEKDIYFEHLHRFAEFGKMSSGFFHDLMTPLTSMSLHVEQLKVANSGAIAGVAGHLDNVLDAADRMSEFIRIVRKQLESQTTVEQFDIARTIALALSIVTYKARQSSVELRSEGSREVTYYGSSTRLYQVIINLVSNALDAFESTSFQQKIVVVSLHADSDQIFLSVRDNGAGISADMQSKIFEPFFTTKHAQNGLGIGLSITREIVARDFKGHITVASTPGKGSIFTVVLPRV
jgi:signal transduction histidine kinase